MMEFMSEMDIFLSNKASQLLLFGNWEINSCKITANRKLNVSRWDNNKIFIDTQKERERELIFKIEFMIL